MKFDFSKNLYTPHQYHHTFTMKVKLSSRALPPRVPRFVLVHPLEEAAQRRPGEEMGNLISKIVKEFGSSTIYTQQHCGASA